MSYLSEIFSIIGEKGKRSLLSMVVIFLFLSILDVIGIGLIAPYLSLIGGFNLENVDKISDFTGNINILPGSHESMIIVMGIVLVILFFVKTLFVYYVNYRILSFSQYHMIRLRTMLMRTYQSISYSDYLQTNSAEHVHVIQNLTSSLTAVLMAMLKILSESIVGIIILTLLLIVNSYMVIFLAIFLGGGVWIFDIVFRNKLFIYGQTANNAAQNMLQGIKEGMYGLKDIRVLGKEKYFYKMVENGVTTMAENERKASLIQVMPRYILEFFLVSFVVIVVIIAINISGSSSELMPTIVLFGVASLRLMPAFSTLSNSLTTIRHNRHAIQKLHKDLSSIKDKSYHEEGKIKSDKYIDFNSLHLNNVNFSYSGNNMPALKNISLNIYKNESIGIIGSSGSGKTTLVNVMLGLLVPQEGDIFYNNILLNSTLTDWWSHVAYLPQQVFLTDDTLRNNVALGEDGMVDDSRVFDSLRQAELLDFVKQLPNGIDTFIGEGGIRLSGGQRQRVALARAFYFNRNVLIMDESTSSLDNETEREIIREVKSIKGKRTLIIVAHRMSTVQHCDRIYRMHNGEIIDEGDYHSVVEKSVLGSVKFE